MLFFFFFFLSFFFSSAHETVPPAKSKQAKLCSFSFRNEFMLIASRARFTRQRHNAHTHIYNTHRAIVAENGGLRSTLLLPPPPPPLSLTLALSLLLFFVD